MTTSVPPLWTNFDGKAVLASVSARTASESMLLIKDIQTSTDLTASILTMPRFFGYSFNPLTTYYYIYDPDLFAVVLEAHNTFGEAHIYVVHHSERHRVFPDDSTYISLQRSFGYIPIQNDISGEGIFYRANTPYTRETTKAGGYS
jgi:hypothetical protein